MPNSNADLDDLINEPRETLDVEVKEWLDLTDSARLTCVRASLSFI
jgi:hypothetical protein